MGKSMEREPIATSDSNCQFDFRFICYNVESIVVLFPLHSTIRT